jgi:hypothetical protein
MFWCADVLIRTDYYLLVFFVEVFMRFAFISRHVPTEEQVQLATEQGIELVHVGDADAFTVSPSWLYDRDAFDGAVVVHPAAALHLAGSFLIGVFENANRAPAGAPPQFEAKALHIFDLRD